MTNNIKYNIVSSIIERDCPVSGLIIDVVEFDDDHYAYRLYRDNFEDYSDANKEKVFEWIKLKSANAMTIGNLHIGLEMAEYPHTTNEADNE